MIRQIGNLASVCVRKTNVLFQALNGRVTVHIGYGPDREVLSAAWDDDEKISEIIMELNFGRYSGDDEIKNHVIAKGDPYKMCRFIINNSDTRRTVNTPKYRTEIIELLRQNTPINKAHEKIVEIGCNAKLTAFRCYCRRIIDELNIECSRKNSAGVGIKKDQTVNVHYVSKKDVFRFMWSNVEMNNDDRTYIFGKYPILEEICNVICDFRDIYDKEDTKLLDNFINKYLKSSIPCIKSFANGLKLDITAVKNSVTSELNNGFVEGCNNKVKLIKRSMFGRAKLKLLRAKILLAW